MKNIIGRKYNMLTVLSLAENKVTPSQTLRQVNCLCDCGNTKKVVFKYLKRGEPKSCGCLANIKVDIEKENKYGMLTILKEVESHKTPKGKSHRKVMCQCDCGNIKAINLNSIRTGKTTNCGCVFKAKISPKKEKVSLPTDTEDEVWKDSITCPSFVLSSKGRVFSKTLKRFVGINKSSVRTKDGLLYLPDEFYKTFIGSIPLDSKIIHIDSNKLNNNIVNLFPAVIIKDSYLTWVDNLIRLTRMGARKRLGCRATSSLTRKIIIDKFIEQRKLSEYLKIEMDLTMQDKLRAISVDRIDNNKGYEEGNINLVTRFENTGRGDAMIQELNIFLNRIN